MVDLKLGLSKIFCSSAGHKIFPERIHLSFFYAHFWLHHMSPIRIRKNKRREKFWRLNDFCTSSSRGHFFLPVALFTSFNLSNKACRGWKENHFLICSARTEKSICNPLWTLAFYPACEFHICAFQKKKWRSRPCWCETTKAAAILKELNKLLGPHWLISDSGPTMLPPRLCHISAALSGET